MENKKAKILLVALIVVIIAAGAILAVKMKNNKTENVAEELKTENTVAEKPVEEKKEVQIFNGDDRPIGVMIDNHSGAWPQAGLNKTYLVYEIVVEGGETRLFALFKGANVNKIGPVRSSRHYFLDYAMENDAIYTHYGWSPQAKNDISKFGINNINGIFESSSSFWRTSDKYAPHNVATSTKAIKKIAKAKGYKTTSKKGSVLNYTTDEVNLEDGQSALKITIPHSYLQTVRYEYDAKKKVYKRYARNKLQTEWDSGKTVTTKNIIITKCDNYSLANTAKGRQGLKNIGTFDGYYITNGKAIKIKCIKSARNKQTKYQDLNGNEIKVNDGNTWINICPKKAKIKIVGEKTKKTETTTKTTNNI